MKKKESSYYMKTFDKTVLFIILVVIVINIVNYILTLSADYDRTKDKNYIYNIPLSEIVIPHPKKLYTYQCNEQRRCESKSNTFIINMEGIDFIPPKEFISLGYATLCSNLKVF